MYQAKVMMPVRKVNGKACIIDVHGDVTASVEQSLLDAYNEATCDETRAIVLNLNDMEYMDSSGIGVLIGLLMRAQREQRQLLSYGLSPHYREIFAVTQLNRVIGVYNTEKEALAAARQSV